MVHQQEHIKPICSEELTGVDQSLCRSALSVSNRLGRLMWGVVWLTLFRPTPKSLYGWRRMLLRWFGAEIGRGVHIYPSVRIFSPWKLKMGDHSCLAPFVDCYCVDDVRIGANSTISQYSFLCTASHDYEQAHLPLTTAPIDIGYSVWICADVYVGPGVKVGDGAVVGVRSSVYKNVAAWTVVGGNPAKFIKPRVVKNKTT